MATLFAASCTGSYEARGGGGGGEIVVQEYDAGNDPGEGDPGEGDPGDPPPADSPDAGPPGGEQGICLVQDSYGALGPLPSQTATRTAQQQQPANDIYRLVAQLDPVTNDYVTIELWEGYGPFIGGPVTPGTYPIGAADVDYDTCGICILLAADVDPATAQAVKTFIATGGTVTVTSVTGSFAGSIAGITLSEMDPATSAPLAGGTCASSIDSATFSDTLP